ncbi:ABC transporter permease ['Santalum album' aster yellows phytoplasma]|uniref:ABC transporter permease n=1 Tax='Santalum album' aster yellows phytoplasma TaxID=2831467 RepID=A0ABS5LLE8_9MOLU|nr:ABC transporter permease ['Santalum album' aster yellows phytoplasma]MBS2993821.1 ABC transporter permease ['Santalum album' aster yellows phytoplasma]
MIQYIFKKFFYALAIFITVIIISFFAVNFIPGDPVSAMFGQRGSSQMQRAIIEKELGLDKSIGVQFQQYLKKIFLKFDFGNSYRGENPKALSVFTESFVITFQLAFFSCLIGSLMGIFLGTLSTLFNDNKKSTFLEFYAILMISTPTFIVGYLLQIYLATNRGIPIFEISGWDNLRCKVLPILTLSLIISGSVLKTTQTNMKECLEQPYIKTAYAKGLSKKTIIFKHALKNALIPIISHIGLIFSFLIGGSIVTEKIFNIRGVGSVMLDSFEERNFPVLRCCIILLALFVAVFNLCLDLIYFWLNPKLNKNTKNQ